jgi:hypothetical protein
MKSLYVLGTIALAIAPLHGQTYWSANPDCSTLNETPVAIYNTAGTVIIGYSCYVSGTFVWLAAGGEWGTTIRVAAPSTAPIGVDYTFYDVNGNPLNLDTEINNQGSTFGSGSELDFALDVNQPAEVELLGATNNAPGYHSTATGSVYATFYCPDADTCSDVLPQLLYSALPSQPWSLSVPIAWDDSTWTQWSAVGINDNGPNPEHLVSLVIYNEDTSANSYTVSVYDSNGTFISSGTTRSIPPLQDLGGGTYGEGGTYGVLLSEVVPTLPSGTFKVLVDGGSLYSAVEVLQIDGPSATTLQVAYDEAPGSASARKGLARAARRPSPRKLSIAARPKRVFRALPK